MNISITKQIAQLSHGFLELGFWPKSAYNDYSPVSFSGVWGVPIFSSNICLISTAGILSQELHHSHIRISSLILFHILLSVQSSCYTCVYIMICRTSNLFHFLILTFHAHYQTNNINLQKSLITIYVYVRWTSWETVLQRQAKSLFCLTT